MNWSLGALVILAIVWLGSVLDALLAPPLPPVDVEEETYVDPGREAWLPAVNLAVCVAMGLALEWVGSKVDEALA